MRPFVLAIWWRGHGVDNTGALASQLCYAWVIMILSIGINTARPRALAEYPAHRARNMARRRVQTERRQEFVALLPDKVAERAAQRDAARVIIANHMTKVIGWKVEDGDVPALAVKESLL